MSRITLITCDWCKQAELSKGKTVGLQLEGITYDVCSTCVEEIRNRLLEINTNKLSEHSRGWRQI